jgi:hypothetical protein
MIKGKEYYEVWNNECMGNLLIAEMKTPKGALNQAKKMLDEGHDKITITRYTKLIEVEK